MNIAKQIIDDKTRHAVLVLGTGCLDGDEGKVPQQVYSYMLVKPSRLEALQNLKFDGSTLVDVSQFCNEVIHSDYGLPTEEVRKYMEEHYRIIHPAELPYPTS